MKTTLKKKTTQKKKKLPVKSETIGLWGNGSGAYTSKLYHSNFIEQIGSDIRFCLIFNPQHHKDDNRPRFLLRIYNNEGKKVDDMAKEIKLAIYDGDAVKKEVIATDDAIDIATNLCRDACNGYSIDDLVVEVPVFMQEKSFEAVDIQEIDDWKWE